MPSPSLAPLPGKRLEFIHWFTISTEVTVGLARRSQKFPDYFTLEEAGALVEAAPSFQTRMAFRIMLRTGLRVFDALALRRVDLRLNQDPPIIVVRADSPGNKARKGQEVPVPADLVERLHDLASLHYKDRQRPMLDISRWRLSQVMKETARDVGIEPIPTLSATPTVATAYFAVCQSRSSSNGWGISPWPIRSATWSWPEPTTNG